MNPALCSYPSVPNSEKAQLKQPPSNEFFNKTKVSDQDPGTTQPEANSSPINHIILRVIYESYVRELRELRTRELRELRELLTKINLI